MILPTAWTAYVDCRHNYRGAWLNKFDGPPHFQSMRGGPVVQPERHCREISEGPAEVCLGRT
jgi:hypothetical protein